MLSRPTIVSLDSPLAELEARQIGDKALMLHTMMDVGLNVPRGFVIPAETAKSINETHWPTEITDAARNLGDDTLYGLRGSPLTSVQGLGESLLNIGYNDELAEKLAVSSGEPRAAYETYRRFIQDYAQIVMGDDPAVFDDIVALYMEERGFVSDTELQGSDARELANRFKAQFESNNGIAFPQTLDEQLRAACIAVNRSWNAPRAKTHRKLQGIPDNTGLALIIHEVVQTGLGETSGVGRATTRDNQTGEAKLSGTFAPQAIRPALASDMKDVLPLQGGEASLASVVPAAFNTLHEGLTALERHLREGIEAEFAVSDGKVYFLSARPARRSARAALHMAIDFANQRLLSREEAVLRVDPFSLDKLLHATIAPDTKRTVIATGLGASPGAVAGMIVFDADEARDLAAQGAAVILVRPETLPEDIRGLHAAEGVLTTRGSMASHAAVIARGMGKPAVTGASNLKIDVAEGKLIAPGLTLKRGDIITIDGSSGQILKGRVETEKPEISGDFATLLKWADNYRRMKVRANAETVTDARMARDFGAEGIGLVRTEHMFFEGDRLVAIREMILADKEKDRRAALAKALPMLRGDFIALFEIMTGLPVTIRLLDPPLHEFLPEGGAETDAVAKSLGTDGALLRKRINELSEQNPMLGHRGVRLLLSYPEIVEMQARAACGVPQRAGPCPPHHRSGGPSRQKGDRPGLRISHRHHDRTAPRRTSRGRHRAIRRVLLLRHQRPHPNHLRHQPRRQRPLHQRLSNQRHHEGGSFRHLGCGRRWRTGENRRGTGQSHTARHPFGHLR
jgi:pyruvate, orthophosphate dikinase